MGFRDTRLAGWMRTLSVWVGKRFYPLWHQPHKRWIYSILAYVFITLLILFVLLYQRSWNDWTVGQATLLICTGLVFLVGLVIMVARYFVSIWARRKGQQAGARLHARLVTIFGLSAALPTLLMVVFASFSFHQGLQGWFTAKNQSVLRQSMAVASGYLEEQHKVVRADAELLMQALTPYLLSLEYAPQILHHKLEELLSSRGLDEGVILDHHLKVLASSHLTLTLQFETLSSKQLQDAELYPVIMTNERGDRLRALIAFPTEPVRYLYVGRLVDAQILGYLEKTHGAVAEFHALEKQQGTISLFFILMTVMVGILVVLCAVGLALMIADQMIQPISHLMAASERIRSGDLNVRVSMSGRSYELGLLIRTFNRMIRQIAWQQKVLLETNQDLETRKNLLQTVLAGVRSGVIGLDEKARIQWPNHTASEILHLALDHHLGVPLVKVLPSFMPLLMSLDPGKILYVQGEISYLTLDTPKTLFVRMATHTNAEGGVQGYVVTFDDVTTILEAQRQATWSEAAKRVAHEIKNPLTPIRLAAERLRKKLTLSSSEDQEVLTQCTQTIIRQVDAIKQLVDAFSSLAHQSKQITPLDLHSMVRDTLALHGMAHPKITVTLECLGSPRPVMIEHTAIIQILNNVLINATQSIESRPDRPSLEQGMIHLTLDYQNEGVTLRVEDNGAGLPLDLQDRLTEPYVTTKIGGTGLGLSIVQKIMDEHKGRLSLENRPSGGACVVMFLPYSLLKNQPPSKF